MAARSRSPRRAPDADAPLPLRPHVRKVAAGGRYHSAALLLRVTDDPLPEPGAVARGAIFPLSLALRLHEKVKHYLVLPFDDLGAYLILPDGAPEAVAIILHFHVPLQLSRLRQAVVGLLEGFFRQLGAAVLPAWLEAAEAATRPLGVRLADLLMQKWDYVVRLHAMRGAVAGRGLTGEKARRVERLLEQPEHFPKPLYAEAFNDDDVLMLEDVKCEDFDLSEAEGEYERLREKGYNFEQAEEVFGRGIDLALLRSSPGRVYFEAHCPKKMAFEEQVRVLVDAWNGPAVAADLPRLLKLARQLEEWDHLPTLSVATNIQAAVNRGRAAVRAISGEEIAPAALRLMRPAIDAVFGKSCRCVECGVRGCSEAYCDSWCRLLADSRFLCEECGGKAHHPERPLVCASCGGSMSAKVYWRRPMSSLLS